MERLRHQSAPVRLLRERARRAGTRGERAVAVLVPPLFGTRLADEKGRMLWGQTRRIFFGPSIGGAERVKPQGLLEHLPILPGIFGQDIFGGLMRFLEQVGGYRRGEDLFVLDYDWRKGIPFAAAELDTLIRKIRGIGNERVDLLCVSSGGAIGRYYLAYGGADMLAQPAPEPSEIEPGMSSVRRMIYVASPQRGSFGALAHIHEGIEFLPWTKHFPSSELVLCQTAFDYIPHPKESVFVDEQGNTIDLNIFDAQTWLKLGIANALKGISIDDFSYRLDKAHRLHQAFDSANSAHPDTLVIGARHLPTRARFLIQKGKAILPDCDPPPKNSPLRFAFEPGDGALPESSLLAVPGLQKERLWLVKPKAHHLIEADPSVHRFILEALLSTDRPIPKEPPLLQIQRKE